MSDREHQDVEGDRLPDLVIIYRRAGTPHHLVGWGSRSAGTTVGVAATAADDNIALGSTFGTREEILDQSNRSDEIADEHPDGVNPTQAFTEQPPGRRGIICQQIPATTIGSRPGPRTGPT